MAGPTLWRTIQTVSVRLCSSLHTQLKFCQRQNEKRNVDFLVLCPLPLCSLHLFWIIFIRKQWIPFNANSQQGTESINSCRHGISQVFLSTPSQKGGILNVTHTNVCKLLPPSVCSFDERLIILYTVLFLVLRHKKWSAIIPNNRHRKIKHVELK